MYRLKKVFELCRTCYKNQWHMHNNYPNLLRSEKFPARVVELEATDAVSDQISMFGEHYTDCTVSGDVLWNGREIHDRTFKAMLLGMPKEQSVQYEADIILTKDFKTKYTGEHYMPWREELVGMPEESRDEIFSQVRG